MIDRRWAPENVVSLPLRDLRYAAYSSTPSWKASAALSTRHRIGDSTYCAVRYLQPLCLSHLPLLQSMERTLSLLRYDVLEIVRDKARAKISYAPLIAS